MIFDLYKQVQKSFTVTTTVLASASWSENIYSFEGTFPNANYDIFVEINGDICTDDQISAFSSAQLVGSPTSNIIKALGTVPEIDIPVVVFAYPKAVNTD